MSLGDINKKNRHSSAVLPIASVEEKEPEVHQETAPASNVTIHNAYIMGPAFGEKFPVAFIRHNVQYVLNKLLKGSYYYSFVIDLNLFRIETHIAGKTYAVGEAGKWAREIVDTINTGITGLACKPRYKHVIQAVIYQQSGSGFFCGARAVWDPLSDDYNYYTYDGGTFVCIVMFFGLYQY